jgi:hypothetical protein
VPDHEQKGRKLAGELSENVFKLNCRYIGPLSRLRKKEGALKYDHLFLLSGPEPTQTDLLNTLAEKLQNYKGKAMMVTSSEEVPKLPKQVKLMRLPSTEELSAAVTRSKIIVCRSGYSTLMDLDLLGKKELILIPTPGQTEQEYLAEYWSKKFKAVHLPEDQLGSYTF